MGFIDGHKARFGVEAICRVLIQHSYSSTWSTVPARVITAPFAVVACERLWAGAVRHRRAGDPAAAPAAVGLPRRRARAVGSRASPAVGELRGETFEQVVVFLFLPVLVFAAALDRDLRVFLHDNLRAVLALAVVGFVVSAVLVGVSVHLALSVPLVVALLFGALISATDPAAVVTVFRDLGVPRRLLVLVEGRACSTTASPSSCRPCCSPQPWAPLLVRSSASCSSSWFSSAVP